MFILSLLLTDIDKCIVDGQLLRRAHCLCVAMYF